MFTYITNPKVPLAIRKRGILFLLVQIPCLLVILVTAFLQLPIYIIFLASVCYMASVRYFLKEQADMAAIWYFFVALASLYLNRGHSTESLILLSIGLPLGLFQAVRSQRKLKKRS